MATLIELTTLDLRFQDYRMRDDAREARLRASIAERGIEEPLQGIDLSEDEDHGGHDRDHGGDTTANRDDGRVDAAKNAVNDENSTAAGSVGCHRALGTESQATTNKIRRVLLNGFQRYRCAKKLKIHEVPYVALAQDEAAGIIHLLRVAQQQRLGNPDGMSEFERELLRNLEQLRKLQLRVLARLDNTGDDARLTHRAFLAEAHVVVSGLLSECEPFFQKLRMFYDRIGQTQ